MKTTVTKRAFTLMLALLMLVSAIPLMSLTAFAASTWPSLSTSAYCEFTATKTIYCYRNSSCTTRGTITPLKSYNAAISKGDRCLITGISDSWIRVAYPTSSGYRTAYIKRTELFNVAAPTEKVTSQGKATVYLNTNGTTYGSTAKGDDVYVCGTTGNCTIIMYTAKSGSRAYKMGYVKTSDFNSIIKGNSGSQNVSTSGWQMPMTNAYCTWKSSGNWSWATYTSNSSGRNYHLGIDIYGSNGTVYAAASGKVVAASSSNSGANGRYIIIKHTLSGKTVYSFYAHLSSINVSVGQSVNKGSTIGAAGGSGYGKNNNYGTHLHFAIVDTLWTSGNYYGYATYFTGNKVNYKNVTYYNPIYVVNNSKLP